MLKGECTSIATAAVDERCAGVGLSDPVLVGAGILRGQAQARDASGRGGGRRRWVEGGVEEHRLDPDVVAPTERCTRTATSSVARKFSATSQTSSAPATTSGGLLMFPLVSLGAVIAGWDLVPVSQAVQQVNELVDLVVSQGGERVTVYGVDQAAQVWPRAWG